MAGRHIYQGGIPGYTPPEYTGIYRAIHPPGVHHLGYTGIHHPGIPPRVYGHTPTRVYPRVYNGAHTGIPRVYNGAHTVSLLR